ncbi:MAG: D-alanine--D-alanine ligase [Gammaproteobacteria bacterium]
MKRYRILLLTHEQLVPPESIDGLTDDQIDEFRTDYNVYSTLHNLGHEIEIVGVSDSLAELREKVRETKPHIVFNLLEEFSGIPTYDMNVVSYLELIRQRYTGCNPRGLLLSHDKVLTKQVLAWHRVVSPAFHLFPFGRQFSEPKKLKFPLFVKSATEDASLGISQASIVEDMDSLRQRVEFIHSSVQSDALVEEYIEGREIYVGILGNKRLTTLPPWELHFGSVAKLQSGIATRKVKWDRKYQEKHGIKSGLAKDLSAEQVDSLHRVSKRIYRALHLSGYARLDFRLKENGSLYLLEANANPNLTHGEDLAESAEANGINYDALITRIVNLGLAYMPEWRMFE